MFEIGSALREARERRRLTYSQVEEETKIRARYIRALEEEDFGVLPGATYAKGFLRAYADYLGLDGHLFIDEFNSRHHDPRREDDRPIYPPSRRRAARHRRETSVVLIALAAVVCIATIVFVGWSTGTTAHTNLPTPTNSTAPQTGGTTGTSGTSSPSSSADRTTTHSAGHDAAASRGYRITITGGQGGSWIAAHHASSAGPAVLSVKHTDLSGYMLGTGEVAVIEAKGPVWIQIGRPGSVTLRVAGHDRTLPPSTTYQYLITRQGIRAA